MSDPLVSMQRAAEEGLPYYDEATRKAGTGPAALATELGAVAAKAVISKVAGETIGGAILGFFGYGGDVDYTQYFNRIDSRLDTLTAEADRIEAGLGELRGAVTSIAADIRESALQTALGLYVQNKNTIVQAYASLSNAAAGALSKDRRRRAGAVKAMFDLVQITTANEVSRAMLNVHDELYGAGQLKGIIEYQVDVCDSAVTAWASDVRNLEWKREVYPYIDYSTILTEFADQYARTQVNVVLPNLKAMLATELQGLAFLIAAWSDTAQEPQLATHVAHITAQIAKMRALHATLTDPGRVDRFISQTITAFARPMPQEVYDRFCWNSGRPDGNLGGGNLRYWHKSAPPFDKAWVSWGKPKVDAWWPGVGTVKIQGQWPDETTSGAPCIIRTPINYGGPNQMYYIYSIAAQEAGGRYYYAAPVDRERRPSGPNLPPIAVTIPYPHTFTKPEPKEWSALMAALPA